MTTMAILTKLLATKIVASKRSGALNNFKAIRFNFESVALSISICVGVNEKKATSLPDTKPERRSNNTITSKPIITPGVMLPTVIVLATKILLIERYGSASKR